MLTAALDYARASVAVIPLHTPRAGRCSCRHAGCGSIGKHPRTEHGLSDATTDPDAIARWWRLWPDANVGGVVPAGYSILDADVPGVELVPTLRARTGRGSHNWHTTDNGSKAAGRPGVDVRHAGANYVVLPPSLHASGARYAWDGAFDLARAVPLPIEWTEPHQPAEASSDRFRLPTVIEQGGRNRTLLAYGGALRRVVEDDALVRAALRDANQMRCRPPLAARELDTLTGSVLRYRPGPTVILDLRDEPEPAATEAEPTSWTRLPPLARVPVPPKLLDPYVCASRSMLFGAGGAGKGALSAVAIAALSTGDAAYLPGTRIAAPVRVGILDYEDNADEWAERLQRLDIEPVSMPYLNGRQPLTRKPGLERAAAWVKDEGVEVVLVDSVIPAASIADAMRPEGPTAYYVALGQLGVPSWSLAHVPKAQAQAEAPFGSTYWSTPQRLVYRVEKLDMADHVVRLVNTKHSRWPWTPSTVLRIEWGERLRVQPTSLVLDDTTYPLIDRIVSAIVGAGSPLTADELAECVGSTADSVRVQVSRHTHRIAGDGRRPQRYNVR